jgi:hypothetical protein
MMRFGRLQPTWQGCMGGPVSRRFPAALPRYLSQHGIIPSSPNVIGSEPSHWLQFEHVSSNYIGSRYRRSHLYFTGV